MLEMVFAVLMGPKISKDQKIWGSLYASKTNDTNDDVTAGFGSVPDSTKMYSSGHHKNYAE